MRDILDIDDDQITRIPLRKSQHDVVMSEKGDEIVITIRPKNMYQDIAERLANPVEEARNSEE